MAERHLSPALHAFPPEQFHVAPLTGVEARIYNRLWRLIVEGRLKPGAKLREEVIGKTFGVSRTITRKVLQIMEQEGGIHLPLKRGAYVAKPAPGDAAAVFEALDMTMTHIIARLADSATAITSGHRDLIAQHIAAQAEADASGNLVTAHLMGTDFLVLLAAIHGNPVITGLTDRMFMCQALTMTLYGQYVLDPHRTAFQRKLADAIFAHRQDEAIAIFRERYREHEQSLCLDDTGEEADLAAILSSPPFRLGEGAEAS
ncbi:MAG: GntR family transcriptional regulator [Novosphingobium sp.]|jgi:DNA-binding GntR family transcriptional regulator|nr:GntR family transcriptional regulator [Novosphingobium sp.]